MEDVNGFGVLGAQVFHEVVAVVGAGFVVAHGAVRSWLGGFYHPAGVGFLWGRVPGVFADCDPRLPSVNPPD